MQRTMKKHKIPSRKLENFAGFEEYNKQINQFQEFKIT